MGRWEVDGTWVRGDMGHGEWEVFDAWYPEVAQHICDAHNYLLPLINQLLFRQRSEEDLHEPTTGRKL